MSNSEAAPDPAPLGSGPVVVLRLFAGAREAAGRGRVTLRGVTAGDVLAQACSTYGPQFAAVAATSRLWVNGEEVPPWQPLAEGDEVAILPPVSGGAV